jgi:hypothetical protein
LVDWTQTLNTIDYAVADIKFDGNYVGGASTIKLNRIGRTPMPIDVLVEYTDGSIESFYIPLRMMSFQKENPMPKVKRTTLTDWTWGNPNYTITIKGNKTIKKVTIDPLGMMADVKRENNILENK